MASMTNTNFEPLGKVRTKIVATVGPASRDPAVLRKMVEAGVDVFRLNFSHGTHDEHSATLETIRAIGEETGRQSRGPAGPGRAQDPARDIPGDVVECDFGAEFCLAAEPKASDDPHQLTCTYHDAARRPRSRPERPVRRRGRRDGRDRTRSRLGPAQGHAAGTAPVAAGHQRPERGAERRGADRQGPRRPRLDGQARRRVRRPLVRAAGSRTSSGSARSSTSGKSAPGSSPRSRSPRPSPTSMRSSPRPTP